MVQRAQKPVLRFTKGTRGAKVRLTTNPLGVEIRALVNREFPWSPTCRSTDGLRDKLAGIHADFRRVWIEMIDAHA